ncbi:MFS transporter [Teichococcus aestuarii]|uniref:MFS transporter n=1 Tax=Teichococcus aestuarii TaxID=568898 RepID=UPI003611B34E
MPLLTVFAEPDFRRLWIVGLVIFGVRWIETIAVGVFVYQERGSALLVATMMLLRLVPMALLGAFLGAWAERMERRTALLLIVLASFATSLALGLLAIAEALQVWHLAVASLINGVSWAADNPVRRMMLGQVVGAERMSIAMSVDVGTNNASRMLGPTLGGVLLATTGIQGPFLLSALFYLVAIGATLRLTYRNEAQAPSGEGVLGRVAAGVRLVLDDRRLTAIMIVTLIYNIFAWPTTSMVPVIGQDRLLLGAEGVGFLASMDGVGAFFGALLIALAGAAGPLWPPLCRRRRLLLRADGALRAAAACPALRSGAAAGGAGRLGLQHHADHAGVSRHAAGDAQPRARPAFRLHRRRAGRLHPSWPAGGCDRRALRRGAFRRRGPAGTLADAPLVAKHFLVLV